MARWRNVKNGKLLSSNKTQAAIENNNCNALLIPRFKAFITDSFMLFMPLVYIVFYFIMGSREAFADDKISGWVYILVPHFVSIVAFWYFKSQTPGMKAYEIGLIDAKTSKTPTLIQLCVRYFAMTLSVLLILPLLIPYFNKNKKTLWDYASQTCMKHLPNESI